MNAQKLIDTATIAVAAIGISLCFVAKSKAETVNVRIVRDVPTVAGIRPAPTAHEFYRSGQATINVRPSARIVNVGEPAPPNGCPEPAFRVISGPIMGRGCFGAIR